MLRAVFSTKERRDELIARYRALEGAKQTLERLAGYVASLASAGTARTETRW